MPFDGDDHRDTRLVYPNQYVNGRGVDGGALSESLRTLYYYGRYFHRTIGHQTYWNEGTVPQSYHAISGSGWKYHHSSLGKLAAWRTRLHSQVTHIGIEFHYQLILFGSTVLNLQMTVDNGVDTPLSSLTTSVTRDFRGGNLPKEIPDEKYATIPITKYDWGTGVIELGVEVDSNHVEADVLITLRGYTTDESSGAPMGFYPLLASCWWESNG